MRASRNDVGRGTVTIQFILLAIFAFFVSPFAIAGFQRAWRGAAVVWLLLALYTAFEWSRPLPASLDGQDEIGADVWRMTLFVLLVGCALAFAGGLTISILRSRTKRQS
jgi:hypothetical protein